MAAPSPQPNFLILFEGGGGEAVHRLVTLLVFNHNLVQPTIMPGTVPLGQHTRNPVTQRGYGKNREMNT